MVDIEVPRRFAALDRCGARPATRNIGNMAISIPARGILIGVLLAAWAALGGGCASNAVDTREVYERYGAQIGAFELLRVRGGR